jgi:hypothetical protein
MAGCAGLHSRGSRGVRMDVQGITMAEYFKRDPFDVPDAVRQHMARKLFGDITAGVKQDALGHSEVHDDSIDGDSSGDTFARAWNRRAFEQLGKLLRGG